VVADRSDGKNSLQLAAPLLVKKLSEEMANAFYARINAVGADDLSAAKTKKRAEMDAVDDLLGSKPTKPKPSGQKTKV
jgi:hypothetical protein